MNSRHVIFLVVLAAGTARAETDGFDQQGAPQGWMCGVTGRGAPKWAVEADTTAPSKPNVLRQSGQGTFPYCAKQGVAVSDGYVEVRFKPEKGREDQAGGVIWRFKDGNNYYIARANALENNVSLYYTTGGSRHTIKYVDAPVAANQWHTLRVDYAGTRFKVSLDGKQYIEQEDRHINGPGSVGVWTKADSVTAFDDFSWEGK
jgi:hypothetical protein